MGSILRRCEVFKIETRVVLESATVELTGEQLQALAAAKLPLARLIEQCVQLDHGARHENSQAACGLQPVVDLVHEIALVVASAGSVAVKKLTGGAAAKAMRLREQAAGGGKEETR